jgi:hypothetical protein
VAAMQQLESAISFSTRHPASTLPRAVQNKFLRRRLDDVWMLVMRQ